jgi:hypothetical protein
MRLSPVAVVSPIVAAVMMTPAPIAIRAITPAIAPTTMVPSAMIPPVTAVIGLLDDTAIARGGHGFQNGDVATHRCGLGAGRCETEAKREGCR